LLGAGHKDEGYGLEWSGHKPGLLVSGSYDHRVCVWDTNGTPSESRGAGPALDPLASYTGHSDAVGDVAWHPSAADMVRPQTRPPAPARLHATPHRTGAAPRRAAH
jgi:WD40 repeat protein